MTDRRNLYLRAYEGDEEAERTLLAQLQRKVAQRDLDRLKHARVADRMLNLDVCGELVLRAARGDRWSRSELLKTISQCDGSRMATTSVGPATPDGMQRPIARASIEAGSLGLLVEVAVVPINPWDMVPPLRVVVYEDG